MYFFYYSLCRYGLFTSRYDFFPLYKQDVHSFFHVDGVCTIRTELWVASTVRFFPYTTVVCCRPALSPSLQVRLYWTGILAYIFVYKLHVLSYMCLQQFCRHMCLQICRHMCLQFCRHRRPPTFVYICLHVSTIL